MQISLPIDQLSMGILTPTVSALLHVAHVWLQSLECGHIIGAVSLTSGKPFIPFHINHSFQNLRGLSLDPFIITWIQIYLTERSQRVVLSGVSSQSVLVTPGIPQSSILGPLLFILMILPKSTCPKEASWSYMQMISCSTIPSTV